MKHSGPTIVLLFSLAFTTIACSKKKPNLILPDFKSDQAHTKKTSPSNSKQKDNSKHLDEQLLQAVSKGRTSRAKQLVQMNANVNAVREDGATPLFLATMLQKAELVQLLLEAGANPNTGIGLPKESDSQNTDRKDTVQKEFESFACEAVSADRKDVVQFLHDLKGDVEALEKAQVTPLHTASEKGFTEIAELLLKENADTEIREMGAGSTPIHIAASSGQLKAVELLIKYKANINKPTIMDGRTPLMLASFAGHTNVVKTLLEAGADINAFEGSGMSALTCSRLCGRCYGEPSLIKLLLKLSPSELRPIIKTEFTALHLATDKGHKEIVKQLLAAKANTDARTTQGATALHIAAARGHEEVVELLLQFQPNAKETDIYGFTALHRASERGHAKTVKLLLGRDSELVTLKVSTKSFAEELLSIKASSSKSPSSIKIQQRQVDKSGWTPLHCAAHKGHHEVVKLLLSAKANPNTPDTSGKTALHVASNAAGHSGTIIVRPNMSELSKSEKVETNKLVDLWENENESISSEDENQYSKVVTLLLDAGAKIETKDEAGKTPLDLAQPSFQETLAELFAKHKIETT